MGSPTAPLHLTMSDLERSYSRSTYFRVLISLKRTELAHILPLYTIRKPYMSSSMALLHLTLGDLERPKSRSLRFQNFITHKEPS